MCAIFSAPCSSAAAGGTTGTASESDGGLTDEEGSSEREANGFVVRSLSPVVEVVSSSSLSPVAIPSTLLNESSQDTTMCVPKTSPVRRKEGELATTTPSTHPTPNSVGDQHCNEQNDDDKSSRINNNKTKTSTNNNNKPFGFPHAAGTASLSRPLAYDAALPPFPPSLFYAMYQGAPTSNNKTPVNSTSASTNTAASARAQTHSHNLAHQQADDTTHIRSEQQPLEPHSGADRPTEDSVEGFPRPLGEDDSVPEGSGLYDPTIISLPRVPPALDYAQQQLTSATAPQPPVKRNTFTFNNTSNYTAQLHRGFYDAYNHPTTGGYHYQALDTIIPPFGTSPNSVGNGSAVPFRSFPSAASGARTGGPGRALQQGPQSHRHRPTHAQEHQNQLVANAIHGSSASVASTPTSHNFRRPVPSNYRAPSISAASVVSSASSVSGYHPSLGYQPAMYFTDHRSSKRDGNASNVVVAAVSSDGSILTMTKRRTVPSAKASDSQSPTPLTTDHDANIQDEDQKEKSTTKPHNNIQLNKEDSRKHASNASVASFAEESRTLTVGEDPDVSRPKPLQKQYFVHNPYQSYSQYSGSYHNAHNSSGHYLQGHPHTSAEGGSQRAGSVATSATTPTTTQGAVINSFPSPTSALNFHFDGSPSYATSHHHQHHYVPSSASALATPPPAYGAQFYDALPWTESSARSSLHDDECDDGSMMLTEGLEDDPNNDYPPNPDYYGLPAIDTPVPQTPPMLGGPPPASYVDANNMSSRNQGTPPPPPPGYDDVIASRGGRSGSTPNATGGPYSSTPTPPQYGLGGGSQHLSSPQPPYSSSSQHNTFVASMQSPQNSSYNPNVNTMSASSNFNPTPNHGKNVHIDALQNVATYVPYYDSAKGSDSTSPPPARRYRHDYHAQPLVLRVSSLPLERLSQAASDMQDVLDAVCGGLEKDRQLKEREEREKEAHTTQAGLVAAKQPHHSSRRITVRVEGAEKSLKSNSVYVFVSTAEEPDTIVAAFQKVTVLMDRKGFHIARTAEERAAVAAYCDRIRNLPQRARHWRMDGLPSTPISFKVM